MKPAELIQYLGPPLARKGFVLDEVQDDVEYGECAAWAIYYRSGDCKLQVYWSSRTGDLNFMVAPSDAPNEFALSNSSKQWKSMFLLSGERDDLPTPGFDADAEADMAFLKARFEIHFESARRALLAQYPTSA